jgi:hypothetical protein
LGKAVVVVVVAAVVVVGILRLEESAEEFLLCIT